MHQLYSFYLLTNCIKLLKCLPVQKILRVTNVSSIIYVFWFMSVTGNILLSGDMLKCFFLEFFNIYVSINMYSTWNVLLWEFKKRICWNMTCFIKKSGVQMSCQLPWKGPVINHAKPTTARSLHITRRGHLKVL